MGNFDKLQDYTRLQALAGRVAQFLRLSSCPTVEIKWVDRGWARPKTNKITIPGRILGEVEVYQRYYVAHEVCHFAEGLEHSAQFKRRESEVLRELWGVAIRKYPGRPPKPPQDHRVYPVRLVDIRSGEVLWSSK